MENILSWGINTVMEYGVMAVISGVFIYLFYILYRNMLALTNTMVKLNTELLNKMFEMQQKQQQLQNQQSKIENEQTEHTDKLNLRMQITQNINQKLLKLLYDLGLQRVCIFEFHNTNQNLSGFPFAKFSCNFELTRKGTLPVGGKCLGLPFGMISYVMSKFDDHGFIDLYNIENYNELEEQSPSLYSLFREEKINHVCYVGLYDTTNNLYGFLYCEYPSDDKEQISQEDYAVMLSYGNIFSTILDMDNKNFDI